MQRINRKKIEEERKRCLTAWQRFRYRGVVEILMMTAAGIGCILASNQEVLSIFYQGTEETVLPTPILQTEEETELETLLETTEETEESESTKGTETQEEPEGDSLLRMNMAYYFPDGADESNAMDSYAGKAFERLSAKDSSWIQEIYAVSQKSPAEVGAMLGKGQGLEQASSKDYWKEIVITFFNGDGTPISGYSNAKEILSLASVYTYYLDSSDGSAFLDYADALWKVSHSYKISVGDLYYCDGSCQQSVDGVQTGMELETDQEPETQSAESDTELEETTVVSREELEAKMESEAMPDLLESANPLEAAKMYEILYVTEPEQGTAESETEKSSEFGSEQESAEQESVQQESAKRSASSVAPKVTAKCPGHVDLHISAYIIGLKENRNLFVTDSIGNQEEKKTENWQGWDEIRRLSAAQLEEQDWYEKYGLSVSTSMYVRNPLSASEIEHYMAFVPSDVSEKRRKVVYEALKSVGCIPYYWGGKPSAAGMEGNHFGTLVSPDKNGRNLKGLDCSGWISWVYWTALGQHLRYESTSGLITEGIATKRSELKTGDIIIRTGADSHVFLFLAWADGSKRSMYLIHETGGSTNNVIVGTYNIDWPFYRNLLSED